MAKPAANYPAAILPSYQEQATGKDITNYTLTQKSDVVLTAIYAGTGLFNLTVIGAFAAWPSYGVIENQTTLEQLVFTKTSSDTLAIILRQFNGTALGAGAIGQNIRYIELTVPGKLLNQICAEITAIQTKLGVQLAGVDAFLDIKRAVRVATIANGTLATAYANGQVVDGITLATGDRILLKNQTAGAENGIYTVNGAGAPTRAVDCDATGEINSGLLVSVAVGTQNGSGVFVLTNTGVITVGATALTFARVGQLDNRICDGRLTCVSGDPCADVAGNQSTLYFTPYVGNRIAIYDGTIWKLYTFSELPLVLTGILTSGRPHDVFVYDNAGVLTLEVLAWTSTTARATAIVLQDGVYVKSGATTRRLLGTIYAISTGAIQDNSGARYVWNLYNRIRRAVSIVDTTDSWAGSGDNIWRAARGTAGNAITYVVGLVEDAIDFSSTLLFSNSAAAVSASSGIGVDSTTVNSAQIFGGVTNGAGQSSFASAHYRGIPAGIGLHTITWLEISGATAANTTWYGDAGVARLQTGMVGDVML